MAIHEEQCCEVQGTMMVEKPGKKRQKKQASNGDVELYLIDGSKSEVRDFGEEERKAAEDGLGYQKT